MTENAGTSVSDDDLPEPDDIALEQATPEMVEQLEARRSDAPERTRQDE